MGFDVSCCVHYVYIEGHNKAKTQLKFAEILPISKFNSLRNEYINHERLFQWLA